MEQILILGLGSLTDERSAFQLISMRRVQKGISYLPSTALHDLLRCVTTTGPVLGPKFLGCWRILS